MPASSCLRWTGALPRPPEWIVIGVSCRIRNWGLVLKGLLCVFVIVLMTVPSVVGDECATKMGVPSDGVSRALLAPQVIEAVLQEKIQSSASVYEAVFRVVRVYKRYRGPGRLKKHRTVSLPFRKPLTENISANDAANRCLVAADLLQNHKYFLFLSSATDRHEPLMNVAPPIPSSKRAKKRIKQVVCDGCAKAPSVGRLRSDSVVRGHSANLTCTFDGSPPPTVTWLKNGKVIDPIKKRNFRIHTRRLRIRPRNRRPRRKRRRRREDRRMSNTDASNVQRRRKSRRKKGMRGRSRSVQVISTLTLAASRKIDEGDYSCVGKSILGEASAKSILKVVAPIDPGIVYPCPYDSFCLNGGTCMFFKHFGEFVCQCAEGYKGQRCQEKEVFPTINDPSCRGPKPYISSSRGLRCPRNQPLWEFVQQNLAARKQKVTPWTKHHHLTWTPTYISGLPWDKYLGRLPTLTQLPTNTFSPTYNEPFAFLQNLNFTSSKASSRRKGQLIPHQFNIQDALSPFITSNASSETALNSSEYVNPQLDPYSKKEKYSHHNFRLKDTPLVVAWDELSTLSHNAVDDKIKNFTEWLTHLRLEQPSQQNNREIEYQKTIEQTASYKELHQIRHRHPRQRRIRNQYNGTEQWNSLPSIRPTSRRTYIYPTSISPQYVSDTHQNDFSKSSELASIKR